MLDSDIVMFLSQEMSDDSTNGGRASTTEVTSGIAQNVLPHVNKATRDAGNDLGAGDATDGQVRKVHISNQNSDDEAWMNVGVVIEDTLGSDWAFFWPETHDSTQSNWEGAGAPTRRYVAGDLKTDILSTATSLTITLKDSEQTTEIQDGDKLYLSNQATPGGAGDTAIVTISGTPSISTLDVTCTIGQPGTAFLASNTKVSVIYEPADDVEPTLNNYSASITGGRTGELTYASVLFTNKGTIRQDVTITFTDAIGNFDVTTDEPGVTLASGNVGVEYAPINPDTSDEYFKIPVAAWADTDFDNGDWIILNIFPASIPIAEQRVIPASCPSLANNRLRVISTGESET